MDLQLSTCEDIKTYINESYGFKSAGNSKGKTQKTVASTTNGAVIANGQSAETAKDKGKAAAAPLKDVENPILLKAIGSDSKKRLWYRIDGTEITFTVYT